MKDTPIGESAPHLGGRMPRVSPVTPPNRDPLCSDRARAMLVLVVLGAYAGLIFVHLELRGHINNETALLSERVQVLETSILPGMLPETRDALQRVRYDIAQLAQRVSLVELAQAKLDAALERVKPLFVPRRVQAK